MTKSKLEKIVTAANLATSLIGLGLGSSLFIMGTP